MKDDFNRDMDDYLSRRKSGPSPKLRIRFGKDKDEKVPNLSSRKVHVEYDKPSFFERLFTRKEKEDVIMKTHDTDVKIDSMTEDLMEVDEEMHRLEEEERRLERKKDSLLTRIFNAFGSSSRQKDDMIEDMPVMEEKGLDPDTVETLKIASRWLNRLTPQEKEAFRRSTDYAQYKEFLDRNGLTKR